MGFIGVQIKVPRNSDSWLFSLLLNCGFLLKDCIVSKNVLHHVIDDELIIKVKDIKIGVLLLF